jgi:hypothetical protein
MWTGTKCLSYLRCSGEIFRRISSLDELLLGYESNLNTIYLRRDIRNLYSHPRVVDQYAAQTYPARKKRVRVSCRYLFELLRSISDSRQLRTSTDSNRQTTPAVNQFKKECGAEESE